MVLDVVLPCFRDVKQDPCHGEAPGAADPETGHATGA